MRKVLFVALAVAPLAALIGVMPAVAAGANTSFGPRRPRSAVTRTVVSRISRSSPAPR
jgi:hypothetical protein